MKSLFFFIAVISIVLISCHSHQAIFSNQTWKTIAVHENQSFLNYTWQVDQPIFFDRKQNTYQLSSTATKNHFGFGHFVTFKEDGTFHGYYSAPCGNDCFTTIDGKYSINQKSELQIFIKTAKQEGFCTNPINFSAVNRGTFKLSQKDNYILLERI